MCAEDFLAGDILAGVLQFVFLFCLGFTCNKTVSTAAMSIHRMANRMGIPGEVGCVSRLQVRALHDHANVPAPYVRSTYICTSYWNPILMLALALTTNHVTLLYPSLFSHRRPTALHLRCTPPNRFLPTFAWPCFKPAQCCTQPATGSIPVTRFMPPVFARCA